MSLAFAKRRGLMYFRKNAVPNGSTLQHTSFVSTKISLKTYIASSRLTWSLLLDVLSLAITLYSSCPDTSSPKPSSNRPLDALRLENLPFLSISSKVLIGGEHRVRNQREWRSSASGFRHLPCLRPHHIMFHLRTSPVCPDAFSIPSQTLSH